MIGSAGRVARRAGIASCLGAFVSILAIAGADSGLAPDEPSPAWRDAPIRYILTAAEDTGYKSLGTEEERRAFIERFWAALDPTPGTGTNERRIEFWKRVEEAEGLFRESLAPGFKSDRGKVYILMGPPDRRDQLGNQEVWTYVAMRRANSVPEIRVHFRRSGEGEFRMRLGDLVYRDPLAHGGGAPAGGWYLAFGSPGASTQIMQERIRMVDFPKGEVTADDFLGPLEFLTRVDASLAERGGTRLLLTLAIPRGQFHDAAGHPVAPDLSLSVQVDDASTEKPAGHFTGLTLLDSPARRQAGLTLLAQTAFSLRPGSYRATLTLYDRQTHLGTRVAQAIEAPDLSRDLALGSIIVGRLPQVDGASAAPFQDGALALAPEPDPVFRPAESVTFAYQVYNAGHRRAPIDLDVTYRFSRKEDGGFLEIGRPIALEHLSQPSIGYTLPLAGWPPGTYRLTIGVRDGLGQSETKGEATFRVAGEAP